MKTTKRLFMLVTVLIMVALVVYILNDDDSKRRYGNDKESIVKVIHSIEGYENRSIEILEIKDVDDYRFVGFLANDYPGIIEFKKNEDGNYQMKRIGVQDNASFSLFFVDFSWFMIVTNHENKVAKFQFTVNNQTIEQQFTPNKKSVTWIKLPEKEDGKYNFRDYKYYDADGQLIKNFLDSHL